MRSIKSLVDKNSESYRANYAANLAAVERLKGELKKSTLGGGEQYVKRHLSRGKLLPRERVEMLLDEGSFQWRIDWTYDALDHVTAQTSNQGESFAMTYDAQGRQATVGVVTPNDGTDVTTNHYCD